MYNRIKIEFDEDSNYYILYIDNRFMDKVCCNGIDDIEGDRVFLIVEKQSDLLYFIYLDKIDTYFTEVLQFYDNVVYVVDITEEM